MLIVLEHRPDTAINAAATYMYIYKANNANEAIMPETTVYKKIVINIGLTKKKKENK